MSSRLIQVSFPRVLALLLLVFSTYSQLSAQTITVTSPTISSSWAIGTQQSITWDAPSSTFFSFVVQYSLNGTTWINAGGAAYSGTGGQFAWTVPSVGSPPAIAYVRVSGQESGPPGDTIFSAAASFTIIFSGSPSLTVTSPSAGVQWYNGSMYSIGWTSAGVANVQLDYSTDGGTTWVLITGSVPAQPSSYSWSIVGITPTINAVVRVTDLSGGVTPAPVSATFSILNPIPLTVTSPNGGETWTIGDTHAVTWTAGTGITTVNLDFSTDAGASWSPIASHLPITPPSYSWIVNGTATANGLIRVSDADTLHPVDQDVSDAVFTTLAGPPTLTITSPVGGESWKIGGVHSITWTSANIANIKIEYSIDGGATYLSPAVIASTPAATGSYSWPIPTPVSLPSLNVRVRLTDLASATTSSSPNDFAISSPWVAQTIPGSPTLNAVSFAYNWGWTVGDNLAIFATIDGGVTWSDISTNPGLPSTPVINWSAVNFLDGLHGWVTGSDGTDCYVYYTIDAGAHWNSANTEPVITGFQPRGISFSSIADGWLVGSGGNIYTTTDHGLSWSGPSIPAGTGTLNGVSFIRGTQVGWVVGASGLILATTDGGTTWSQQGIGATTANLNAVSASDTSRAWAVGDGGIILATVNGGFSWSAEASGTAQNLNAVSFSDGTIGWAVGDGGVLLQYTGPFANPAASRGFSPTGATMWVEPGVDTATKLRAVAIINGRAIAVGNAGLVERYDTTSISGGGSQVFTTQYAALWNLVSVPATVSHAMVDTLFPGAIASAFEYDPMSGYMQADMLEVGMGYWLKFGRMQSTSFMGLPVTSKTIMVMKGWNLIGSVSYQVLVGSITSTPPGVGVLQFFGYDHGYAVADTLQPGKAYWVKVDTTCSIVIDSGPGSSNKLSRIKIKRTTEMPPAPPKDVATAVTARPKQFALEQNYPNPFNPTTIIRYDLPRQSFVRLSIFNVLGQEVRTLVNESEGAGSKSVSFDGSKFPSGLYFYRIAAGNFSDVKKMIMLK